MRRLLLAALGYLVLATVLTWPVARDLTRVLPGDPGGDTGVYVWNVWLVATEVSTGRLPFTTQRIFAATGPADLSQHNTTLAPALIVAPLVRWLGAVAAFNVLYIGLIAGCGVGVFVLAHALTGRAGAAWIGGALAAASPAILARGTEHLSLLAIGIVPVFAHAWLRTLERPRLGWAVWAGAAMALAAYSDPYLAIYATLIAAALLAARVSTLTVSPQAGVRPRAGARRVMDIALALVGLVVMSIVVSGGWEAEVAGQRIVARTLYTPMLVFTVLAVARVGVWLRPSLSWQPDVPARALLTRVTVAVMVAGACLSPWIAALVMRTAEGRLVGPATHWRSSPPGVDLATFLLPSPLHPWWGPTVRAWLDALHPAGFAEFTPTLPLTAVVLIAAALVLRVGLPRSWMAIGALSVACALGPFIHVAGINTAIPGPWAVLRYVPVVAWARSPSRFALVVCVVAGVLAAIALARLSGRLAPGPRRWLVAGVVLVAALELWPSARTTFPARMPGIFPVIAADTTPDASVLELPVGMRDGTSSVGNFSARTQFFQTAHGKRLIGGYLSRISEGRKSRARDMPVYDALLALSEGREVTAAQRARAMQRRDAFVARTGLRYLVIDRRRTPPALQAFAFELFTPEWLATDGDYELYRVHPQIGQLAGTDLR